MSDETTHVDLSIAPVESTPQVEPPVEAPAESPPEVSALRQAAYAAGYTPEQLSEYTDDGELARDLFSIAGEWGNSRALAEVGKKFAPYVEKMDDFDRWLKEQEAAAKAAEPAEPEGFQWQAPEYDEAWERVSEGEDPLGSTRAKLQRYKQFEQETLRKFVRAPHELVSQAVEPVLSQREKALREYVDQKLAEQRQTWEQEQLQAAVKQVQESNKIKSQFLANMSHEIRTPLNSIIGFTELLSRSDLSLTDQSYATHANTSGKILLDIINDILDFSKIEAGMMKISPIRTSMYDILSGCLDVISYQATEKHLDLVLDVSPNLPEMIFIDPLRLRQIILNLLINAVKFTYKGTVELKVGFTQLGGDTGKYHVAISDTGIGITEDQRHRLFKPFSQADDTTTRKFGGTGLGLIISNTLIQAMGSTIELDSTPGKGSTFSFYLTAQFWPGKKPNPWVNGPVVYNKILTSSGPSVENLHPKTPVQSDKPELAPTILIVEDVQINRTLLKVLLKRELPQTAILEAENGAVALELVKSHKVDLIFMDVQMPVMDGLEATRHIRDSEQNSGPRTPIIALTSGALAEERKKCLDEGMDEFLTKPVESEKLAQILYRFFGEKPVLDERR